MPRPLKAETGVDSLGSANDFNEIISRPLGKRRVSRRKRVAVGLMISYMSFLCHWRWKEKIG